MLLGYNTNGFAHHRLEDALVILADLGYQSVAITLDYHALNPFDCQLAGQLKNVKAILEKNNLHCVVETGARFLLDPRSKHQPTMVSEQADQRKIRLDFLCRAVDVATALGADAVSFWSGTPTAPGAVGLHMDRLVKGCQELCDYAGKHNVRLAFEAEPGMFIDTMDCFDELEKQIAHPQFGLTIDIGHLHCQGEEPITEQLRRHQGLLWNVHIEDMRRGIHDHLMFGEGEIDFEPVLATLDEIGYSGGIHVELSRHSHDAVNAARQALSFLQSNLGA
jgi:sugar phosphate isomerase/epimerase